MKFEQMSGTPEYFNEEWEKLKLLKEREFIAIKKGREIGVPEEEIGKFAQDVVAREIEKNNYGIAYRFIKNSGIGTEEEVGNLGKQAYDFYFNAGDFISAMSIAKEAYGLESMEWKRANNSGKEARNGNMEERKINESDIESDEEEELEVVISKNATFADLFKVIDDIEKIKGLNKLHFEEELADNFDEDIAEDILEFSDNKEKAKNTNILDYFEERGYSQDDVSAFLPIRFE